MSKADMEKIKDLVLERISDVVANSMRDNSAYDMEYVRGIVDLFGDIQAACTEESLEDLLTKLT